ncbi:hypothetical protein Sjap_002045 [Stephania japonica]|uniref:Uncharacterized protein n=1 Tax=Stephania japonica TaxID=461633 RepID=A0AAP0KM11_9MAGN
MVGGEERHGEGTEEGSGKNGRSSWIEERGKIKDKREGERAWICQKEEGGPVAKTICSIAGPLSRFVQRRR